MEWLSRTKRLIGEERINKLQNSNVVVFGVGGVGSFVVEGLIRAGLGNITLVDKDTVDITNLNRQIHATTKTIGRAKVEVMKERILEINPKCNVTTFEIFAKEDTLHDILKGHIDYVVDAIDTITSKLQIIEWCKDENIPVISSMGTGNKLDPSKFKIMDISKTMVCPLAKVMRRELKNKNIKNVKVLYSDEKPRKPIEYGTEPIGRKVAPASISFVPSAAGLMIAGEVIRDLIGEEGE